MQRPSEVLRALQVTTVPNPLKGSSAAFLWGPRQTGKSTLITQQFPRARIYNLLESDLSAALAVRPALLREEVLAQKPETVVIDEVQRIPVLLEEVHWLLEKTRTRIILCGSSARKLRRESKNLLGGRAVEHYLFPLTTHEVPDLDLNKFLNHGGLPVHYLVPDPTPLLKSYVNTYIKEEIIDESVTRNIPAFARFLQVVALTHGQQLNYTNVARESGVSANTVRSYFQILSDTLLGFELEPWRKSRTRRLVETAKFFLFDIGIANNLHPEAAQIGEGTDLHGRAFEHFILGEVRAFLSYGRRDLPLAWIPTVAYRLTLSVPADSAPR